MKKWRQQFIGGGQGGPPSKVSSGTNVNASGKPPSLTKSGQSVSQSSLSLTAHGRKSLSQGPNKISTGGQLKLLLNNSMYTTIVLCLSVLFFVVSGIQYWATKYLLLCFHPPGWEEEEYRSTVLLTFAMCALTGPATGVVIGGVVIDKIGTLNAFFN